MGWRPEIVLRQGGNVRGTDSLNILADSRVQSVFVSAPSSPPFSNNWRLTPPPLLFSIPDSLSHSIICISTSFFFPHLRSICSLLLTHSVGLN